MQFYLVELFLYFRLNMKLFRIMLIFYEEIHKFMENEIIFLPILQKKILELIDHICTRQNKEINNHILNEVYKKNFFIRVFIDICTIFTKKIINFQCIFYLFFNIINTIKIICEISFFISNNFFVKKIYVNKMC